MKVNVFLLILAHLLNELSPLAQRVDSSLKDVYVDPFINYHWPHDERGINILWWIKYCTDDFSWIIVMFVLCRVAAKYSFRMFTIAGLWFLYHIIDAFMLWYNYRTGHYVYWILVPVIAGCIVALFIPERKTGQVKSMK